MITKNLAERINELVGFNAEFLPVQLDPARPGGSIQDAIDAMPVEGGVLVVYVPEGRHTINGTVYLRSNVYLLTDGPGELVRGVTAQPAFEALGRNNFGISILAADIAAEKPFRTFVLDIGTTNSHYALTIRNSGIEDVSATHHALLSQGSRFMWVPRAELSGCQVKLGGAAYGSTQDVVGGVLASNRPVQYALSIVTIGTAQPVAARVTWDRIEVHDPICSGAVYIGTDEKVPAIGSVVEDITIREISVDGIWNIPPGNQTFKAINMRLAETMRRITLERFSIRRVADVNGDNSFGIAIYDDEKAILAGRPGRLEELRIADGYIENTDREAILIRGNVCGTIDGVTHRNTRGFTVPSSVQVIP